MEYVDRAADPGGGTGGAGPDTGARTVPGTLRGAIGVVTLEALALVGVALVVIVKTATGTPAELGGALVGAAMALLAGVLLGFGARALSRLQPGVRTPLLVLQLLALPVAYSLWFQGDGHPAYGAPIAVAALVTTYLLFAPPTRAALDPPDS